MYYIACSSAASKSKSPKPFDEVFDSCLDSVQDEYASDLSDKISSDEESQSTNTGITLLAIFIRTIEIVYKKMVEFLHVLNRFSEIQKSVTSHAQQEEKNRTSKGIFSQLVLFNISSLIIIQNMLSLIT